MRAPRPRAGRAAAHRSTGQHASDRLLRGRNRTPGPMVYCAQARDLVHTSRTSSGWICSFCQERVRVVT